MALRVLLGLFFLLGSSTAYAQDLGKLISPGDISSLHKEAEGITNCIKCHELTGGIPNEKCLDCHKEIQTRLDKKRGYHSEATVKEKLCYKCHTDHKGKKFDMVKWERDKFEHTEKNTQYPLKGKHEKTKCLDCHKVKTKMGQQSFLLEQNTCISCHADIHQKTLGEDCAKCHNENTWKGKDVKFDHDKDTKYKLEKGHQKAKCVDCHKGTGPKKAVYKVKDFEQCITCHKKDDKHKNTLGPKCQDCHSVTKWKEIKFNHTKTKYPLTGKHLKVKCESCHPKAGLFKVEKFDTCGTAGCHDTKKRGNIHGKQFAKQKCEDCHTVKGWKPSQFRHDNPAYKGYKLIGKHAFVKCEKCHAPKLLGATVYKPIESKTCDAAGCHDTKKRGNIHGKQFKDQKCTDCHTENGWKPTLFKHELKTYKGYKLRGKHASLKCEKCHTPNLAGVTIFKPIESKTCDAAGCHDTKKRGKIHGKQFKKKQCDDCHKSEEDWKKTTFDHNKNSKYPLTGKHAKAKCEKCHFKDRSGMVVYVPKDFKTCDSSGCHDIKERGYVHGTQFKDKKCEDCHKSTEDWKKLIFDHNKDSRYPLHGKHVSTKCEKCHINKVWKPLGMECIDCHKKDDKHKGELGNKCQECHSVDTWKPGKFFHSALGFPLVGGHKQLQCEDCHKKTDATFTGLSEDCVLCHVDPHFTQFGSTCTDCHSSSSWEPIRFRHSLTGFRLEGMHKTAECTDCHTNRDYRNTPVACFDCHREDFFTDSAVAKHSPSATECGNCHKVYAWSPAFGFAHTVMTFTGAHRSIEGNCSSCHSNSLTGALHWPSAQSESDCAECHQTDYYKEHANGDPSGVSACPQSCTLCHNTNDWDDAKESIRCD